MFFLAISTGGRSKCRGYLHCVMYVGELDNVDFTFLKYKLIWVKYVFVSQVSVNFEISPSSQLYNNLVIHLSKCVNLVL